MWAFPNYAQGCGIALAGGVQLELTTFLAGHDDGELYLLVDLESYRKLYGTKRLSQNIEHEGATYLIARRSRIGGRRDKDKCFIKPLVAGVRVIAHISTALPGIATQPALLTENYYSIQN